MSMIRSPVLYTGDPLHNRLPQLGKAFWYRMRDSSEQRGMLDLPPLVKTVVGSVSGSEYADPRLYQFPNDNGNTSSVQWVAQEEDGLYLEQVLTMQGMVAGEQIIVAVDAAWVDQASTNGTLWSWGVNSAFSQYILQFNTGDVPVFAWRPRNGSAASQALTYSSGDAATAFKGQGRTAMVLGIRVVSSTNIDIEFRMSNATLSGVYTYSGIDVSSGAGAASNPGISGGVTMSQFKGLSIGSTNQAGGNVSFWGRGAANVGRIDQLIGWRGTYNAGLVSTVLTEMTTTNVLDFPPSLCSAV